MFIDHARAPIRPPSGGPCLLITLGLRFALRQEGHVYRSLSGSDSPSVRRAMFIDHARAPFRPPSGGPCFRSSSGCDSPSVRRAMFWRQIEPSSTVHMALLTEGESIVALFYKHSPPNGGRAGKTLRPAKYGDRPPDCRRPRRPRRFSVNFDRTSSVNSKPLYGPFPTSVKHLIHFDTIRVSASVPPQTELEILKRWA